MTGSGACTDSGEFPNGCAERKLDAKGVLIENSVQNWHCLPCFLSLTGMCAISAM